MKIGLDFGTTRIVVAAVDRGNYPLVNFEAPGAHDWFPSVLAISGDRRLYGWEALELQGQPLVSRFGFTTVVGGFGFVGPLHAARAAAGAS